MTDYSREVSTARERPKLDLLLSRSLYDLELRYQEAGRQVTIGNQGKQVLSSRVSS